MKRTPYFPGVKSVSNVMDKVVKPYLQKGGYAFATLILDWQKIVGKEISTYTTPLKLTFSRKEKNVYTLVLQVEPASALLVGFQKGIILEKIATFYGRKFINDLELKQMPLKKEFSKIKEQKDLPPLPQIFQDKLASFDDEKIKEALENLGRSLINRHSE